VIATRTAAHGEGTLRLIEAEGGKAIFQQVDIADNEATHAMAATACGRLDIMVHNAAAFGRSSIQEMDHATLDRLFKHQRESLLHADSGVAATHAQARRGRIITSSVTGPKVSMPGSGAYAVSKAAVTGFIHIAAIELSPDNITVNDRTWADSRGRRNRICWLTGRHGKPTAHLLTVKHAIWRRSFRRCW
jgi:NAD(P)-dependent dehydrogenase (short-subunit alcohol dehydrogenase family)